MNEQLHYDWNRQANVLETAAAAKQFLAGLSDRKAAVFPEVVGQDKLPEVGLGAEEALALFQNKYGAGLSGSPGPRYFGFVTGGATPAALAGDWLASAVDQNVTAGHVFMTHSQYKGTPAIRAAISNSQTTQTDMEIYWQAMHDSCEIIKPCP